MPYQRGQFSGGYEPIDTGYGQFFKNYLEGYVSGLLPMQKQQDMAQQQATTEQIELANALQRAREPHFGRIAELEPMLTQAQIQGLQHTSGQPYSDFGKLLADYNNLPEEQLSQREVFEKYLQQNAMQGRLGSNTEKERAIQALLDPNTPKEQKDLIRQAYGIIDMEGGSNRPISFFPVSTQNALRTQNQQYLDKAIKANEAVDLLHQFKAIVKANPGMHKYFERALTTDNLEPSVWEQLFRNGAISEKQLSALQTATKISNQMAMAAGESLGARQFTDAKLKLIQGMKPSVANTDQANMIITDGLIKQLKPDADELGAILDAQEKDLIYRPKYQLGKYKDKKSGDSGHSSKGFKIIRNPNGVNVKVPDDLVAKALEAGGILVE